MGWGRFRVVKVDSQTYAGHPKVQPWASLPEDPGLEEGHKILGVTMAESSYNEQVGIMSCGPMHKVVDERTEGWAPGDTLWATSDGIPSNVREVAPKPQIYIGVVTADNGDGTFEVDVNVKVLPMLTELSGVVWANDPNDRSFLVYRKGTNSWWPQSFHNSRDISVNTSIQTTELYQDVVRLDASGGPFTLTLPNVTGGLGEMRFELKKVDSTRNRVSIVAAGGYLIEDALVQYLKLPGECLTVQSDDNLSKWWVL